MGAAACGTCGAVVEEKKRNPNFIYLKSEYLQIEFAVSKKTGDVFSADGVKYAAKEVELLASNKIIITHVEHLVKKLFGGEFVGCEKMGKNDNNNTASTPETGTEARSDEFYIY